MGEESPPAGGTCRRAGGGSGRCNKWSGRGPGGPAGGVPRMESRHIEPWGGTSTRCPDAQRPRLPYWNPGEDSYQEAITPERENSPRPWAEGSPRVPAGQGTLPRLGCRTSLPVSRAARIAVDMGRAGVELSGLSKCEGSHILIPGECWPAPASRTCGHYAAVGTHDGCHGARYAASA